MYNNFIRSYFMVMCVFLFLSNVHAMEEPKNNAPYHLNEKWKIQKEYDYEYKEFIKIERKSEESRLYLDTPLQKFFYHLNNNDRVYVQANAKVSTSPKDIEIESGYERLTAIRADIKPLETGGDYSWVGVSCTAKQASAIVLPSICKHYKIPYCLIHCIIQHTDIKGYKTPLELLIERFNEQLNEESTDVDFKRIALNELSYAGDETLQTELTWGLAQYLADSTEHFNRQLIVDLCETITDKKLPCFGPAKLLLGNLSHGDKSQDIETRYKKTLVCFLEANTAPETNLDVFVKGFINNDILTDINLPDELKGLNISAESSFILLNFIRKQNIEIAKLRGNI
jgi:hypothetical protein